MKRVSPITRSSTVARQLIVAFSILGTSTPSLTHAQPAPIAQRDSIALNRHLRVEIVRFIGEWRSAWMESEAARRGLELPRTPGAIDQRVYADAVTWERTVRSHCHLDTRDESFAAGAPSYMLDAPWKFGRLTNGTAAALCPWWSPKLYSPRASEDIEFDSGIGSAWRESVAIARRKLTRDLGSATAQLPGDSLLQRQLVRFLMDGDSLDAALAAARSCPIRSAWCIDLGGLVQYRRGGFRSADSAFRAASRLRRVETVCANSSLLFLVASDDRERIATASCAQRLELEARLWWLATPLFAVGANERELEQRARELIFTLHSDVDVDERFDVRSPYVASMRQLLYRYGWPSYFNWMGKGNETSHESYLSRRASVMKVPYFGPEYSRDRVELLPNARVVSSPFTTTDSDWRLVTVDQRNDAAWWPIEHFRSRQLRGDLDWMQYVTLRRRDSIVLAVAASRADSARGVVSVDSGNGYLIVTSGPMSVRTLASATTSDGVVRLHATIGQLPSLVGVELLYSPTINALPVGFRTRFGISPPEPLNRLPIQAFDISQPVFVSSDFIAKGNGKREWMELMLPSTEFSPLHSKVGVVWESYGISDRDTATISLTVSRSDKSSILGRLGAVVGMNPDARGALTMTWVETTNPRSITELGEIPIQVRSIILDFGSLAPGVHVLQVTMRRASGQEATSKRFFRVAR